MGLHLRNFAEGLIIRLLRFILPLITQGAGIMEVAA